MNAWEGKQYARGRQDGAAQYHADKRRGWRSEDAEQRAAEKITLDKSPMYKNGYVDGYKAAMQ